MAETMYEAPGIGLAATQVDVHQRVVVIDVRKENNLAFINPTWKMQLASRWARGCLSVPGIDDKVERAERVTIKYLDLRQAADDGSRWLAGARIDSTKSTI